MKIINFFRIVAMFLLILQVISPATLVLAESNIDEASEKVNVSLVNQDLETITWKVNVNEEKESHEGIKLILKSNVSLGKEDIKTNEGILIEELSGELLLEIPSDNIGTSFVLTVNKTQDVNEIFLQVEAEYNFNTDESAFFIAESNVENIKKEEVITKEELVLEEPIENEEMQHAKKTSQKDLDDSKDVIGVPYTQPFTQSNSGKALKGMTNSPIWPNAGSVLLNGKKATETSNYGEWDIELSVEAKNTQVSSDIVIVFDRSGSMNDNNRLIKAKEAANKFVDSLLIKGSKTRIAVVSFNNTHTITSDFVDFNSKSNIKNNINNITATGGTNIMAGLRQANLMLNSGNADKQTIVLLSDGEPTYSYKAKNSLKVNSSFWTHSPYELYLSDFNFNEMIGSGSSYNLNNGYSVKGSNVYTNGLPTISLARAIMNQGIDMYSIGLEVGNNLNAQNVLKDSQNKGYFTGASANLSEVFLNIAAKLNYGATNAVVTDPMGEMFNLVMKGSNFNPETDVTISQGTISYNKESETLSWNIGDIKEGEKPTLKYRVGIDWAHKDLKGDILYPMNKQTPLNYTNVNGENAIQQFDIPKGKIMKGKIQKVGYRVNPMGEPINEAGEIVSSNTEAEELYLEGYKNSGSEYLVYGQYSVHANQLVDYTFLVGDDPSVVNITSINLQQTVYFGYVKDSDRIAGEVLVNYLDEQGNELAPTEIFEGDVGEQYSTEQKDIKGYEFFKMDANGSSKAGYFKKDIQTVTYIYKQKQGELVVNKVNPLNIPLEGATFELRDETGKLVGTALTTDSSGEVRFKDLPWGIYTLKESKAPDGYRLITNERTIIIDADNLLVEEIVRNTKQGWEIPKTGGIGTLGFYGIGLIIMIGAVLFLLRKRKLQ